MNLKQRKQKLEEVSGGEMNGRHAGSVYPRKHTG